MPLLCLFTWILCKFLYGVFNNWSKYYAILDGHDWLDHVFIHKDSLFIYLKACSVAVARLYGVLFAVDLFLCVAQYASFTVLSVLILGC